LNKVKSQGLEAYAMWDIVNGELRLVRLDAVNVGLMGGLDLSGCTALEWLICSDNLLSELNIAGCTALRNLICHSNKFTSLDTSDSAGLIHLDYRWNQLTSLDVSSNSTLGFLDCTGNFLAFSILPLPAISCDWYYYAGQTMVLPPLSAPNKNVNLSSEREIDGEYTKYRWYYADGIEIDSSLYSAEDGTFSFAGLDFDEVIYCVMTNNKFPDLELVTSNIRISNVVIPHLDKPVLEIVSNAGKPGTIKAVWTPGANNANAMSFEIRVYSDSSLTTRVHTASADKGLTELDFSVSALSEGTYYVVVVSIGDGINFDTSTASDAKPVTVISVTEALNKPTDVMATQIFENVYSITVELSWTGLAQDWVNGYEIQYSADSGKTWRFWTLNRSTVYTGTINALEISNLCATDYQFRVRAVNVQKEKVISTSDWSDVTEKAKVITAKLGDALATKPKKVTVGKKQLNEVPTISTVTLNVATPASGTVSYIVTATYKIDKTTVFAEFSYAIEGNKLIITGLDAGTKYTFYVAAINNHGNVSADVNKYVNADNQTQAIKDIAKDKGLVKVIVTTAKYTAPKLKTVKNGQALTSIQFTATFPSGNKVVAVDAFNEFVTKMVVSFNAKEKNAAGKNITVSYEATLIDGVTQPDSFKRIVSKVDTISNGTWTGEHPLSGLSTTGTVAGFVTIFKVSGMPLPGMKYTVSVSTIAKGNFGHVESLAGKISISTLKFPALKIAKPVANAYTPPTTDITGSLQLAWSWGNKGVPGGATVTEYQLCTMDANKKLVPIATASTTGESATATNVTGTFDILFANILKPGNNVLYVVAVADNVISLGGKVTIKV